MNLNRFNSLLEDARGQHIDIDFVRGLLIGRAMAYSVMHEIEAWQFNYILNVAQQRALGVSA